MHSFLGKRGDSYDRFLIRVREMYEEYVDNFDPTPQYTFDDYLSLPDFDSWYHFIYLDL